MLAGEGSKDKNRGEDGLKHWRAMQSAYEEYRAACEALESAHQSMDDSIEVDDFRLTIASEQQRAAFERYVDARMDFLEYQFDDIHGPGACKTPLVGEVSGATRPFLLTFAKARPALEVLAVIVLCITAFSFIKGQKRVRGLEAARDNLRATLAQTRGELEGVRQQLNVVAVSLASQAPPVARPTLPMESRLEHPAVAHAQPKARTAQSGNRQTGGADSVRFSLAPSRQFKRVGPVNVSLRSIDSRTGVNLSVSSGGYVTDVQRLRENQPLWIRTNDRRRRLALVIDKIGRNRVDGRLIVGKGEKSQLSLNLAKSRSPASP